MTRHACKTLVIQTMAARNAGVRFDVLRPDGSTMNFHTAVAANKYAALHNGTVSVRKVWIYPLVCGTGQKTKDLREIVEGYSEQRWHTDMIEELK